MFASLEIFMSPAQKSISPASFLKTSAMQITRTFCFFLCCLLLAGFSKAGTFSST